MGRPACAPPGDPAALAQALEQLLGDPAGRARMGEAGRQRVEAAFSIRRMVEQTTGLYRSVTHAPISPADVLSSGQAGV